MKLSLNKMHLYADMHNSYPSCHRTLRMTCVVYITSRGQRLHCKWHFVKGHGVKLQSGPAVSEAFILSGNPQSASQEEENGEEGSKVPIKGRNQRPGTHWCLLDCDWEWEIKEKSDGQDMCERHSVLPEAGWNLRVGHISEQTSVPLPISKRPIVEKQRAQLKCGIRGRKFPEEAWENLPAHAVLVSFY